ncbi:uncharacterized protein Dana_GF17630, isoform C [Drosophila ananassae]|uniref:Uncharacterized protein, isoform C n=1 Tax=Drosophila ananassae TaxID=7217 RepID=A0A0P8YKA3_DROAN|nr:phospholipid-transporting ATPase ABCA3 isoform X3 [Drosophila ananassae]KPU79338.1 uncharacterized protein Dana_GF17630, isoform C [Drosophila ananassae]
MGSCRNFRLLLWKDFHVVLANPTEFILVILSSFFIPLLLWIVMGIIRYDLKIKEAEIFPPKSVHTNLYDELYFSPYNNLIEGFFHEFANETEFKKTVGFIDFAKLEDGLTENARALGLAFPDEWFSYEKFPDHLKLTIYMPAYKNQKNFSYFESGFLFISKKLIISFAQRLKNQANTYLPKVQMVQFPYPRHKENKYAEMACTMPIIILASFFLPTVTIAKHIIAEKENNEKSLLTAMGVTQCLLWMAWYTKAMILFLLCLLFFFIFICLSEVFVFSNYLLLILIFIVYIHSCITFAFLISAFCTKTYWGILATSVLFVITVVPYALLPPVSFELMPQIFCCFCLNSAMFYMFNVICALEQISIGVDWRTFISTIVPEDISILGVLAIMLVMSLICVFLCLYVEQVMPGSQSSIFSCRCCKKSLFSTHQYHPLSVLSYDTARKFVDCCLSPMYYCVQRPEDADAEDRIVGGQTHKDDEPTVHMDRVSKEFRKKTAVAKLSIKMYKDECLAILGPSGSGKTTALHMMGGILRPTSGIIKINGFDIERNPEKAKIGVGFCPQQNVLFRGLTVNQQINFFSLLKGKKTSAANRETSNYIDKLNLKEYENKNVSKLSKGNQRRVSLACSLCGGASVVLCDEPSSGLDPSGKQQLMELLQSEKSGRTIVLATQDVEEGQMLGDRIIILADGQICSQGTMENIKQNNHESYKLSCQMGPNCDQRKVTELVKRVAPSARVSVQGSSISYIIRGSFAEKFVDMLHQLEDRKRNLDVISYSWRDATLEDVFKTAATPWKKRARAGGNIPKRSTEDLATQTDGPDRPTRRAQRAQRAAEAEAAAALAAAAAERSARENAEREARDAENRDREARERQAREREAKERDDRERDDRERDKDNAAREKRDRETFMEKKPLRPLDPETDHEAESDTSEREWRTDPEGGRRNRTCCKFCEAMLMKKALYIWNHKYMFLLILIIPIIWFIVAIYLLPLTEKVKNRISSDLADYIDLNLPSFSDDTVVLLEDPEGYEAEALAYEKLVTLPAVIEQCKEPIVHYLVGDSPLLMEKLKLQYVCGATFDKDVDIIAWYNDVAFEHSSPLALVLVYKAILKIEIGKSFDITLTRGIMKKQAMKTKAVSYRDLDRSLSQTRNLRDVLDKFRYFKKDDEVNSKEPDYPAIKEPNQFAQREILGDHKLNGKRLTLTIGIWSYISLVLSIFILFVVEERVKKLQLQQEIQGLGKFNFWCTHFLWDFVIFCICVIILSLALETYTNFIQILVVLIMIGFACLPFTYVLSLIFSSPEAALVGAFFIHLFTGAILFAFVYVVTALIDNNMYFIIFPTIIGCFGIFKCIYGYKYCEINPAIDSLNCDFGRIHPNCGCDGRFSIVARDLVAIGSRHILVYLTVDSRKRIFLSGFCKPKE